MPTTAPDRVAQVSEAQADAMRLLRFNHEVLGQALALVAVHELEGAPAFSKHAGGHVRHVIEHYETLLLRPGALVLEYDKRARDRELERCTRLARARLQRLQLRLAECSPTTLARPIRVLTRAGCAGEFEISTQSTVARELVFLASHAVHHFALLQIYCAQHGLPVPANFGKAPATVAHEHYA